MPESVPGGFPYRWAPSPRILGGATGRASLVREGGADGEDKSGAAGIILPAMLSGAAAARREEFAAGRLCARAALGAIAPHLASSEIGVGSDREPIWPRGIVGSITHKAGFVSAAVARSDDARAVGIDSERLPRIDRPARFPALVATPAEIERACALTGSPELAITLIFSAKESVYKAIFPLIRRVVGFLDVEIAFEADPDLGLDGGPSLTGVLTVVARVPLLPALDEGATMAGRFEIDGAFVHTGVSLMGR